MLTSRGRRLSLLTLVCAAVTAASLTPAASAATQRYASPAGTGAECSAAAPCGLVEAINQAGDGDEVIVNPGDYSLSDTLYPPYHSTVHGVPGQPRPRLLFNSQANVYMGDATLRYVEIRQAGSGTALESAGSGTVDQVVATGTGPDWATAIIDGGTVRNSLFTSSGNHGIAVTTRSYGYNATSNSTYRNVTAVATGTGGVGIESNASFKAKATIKLVNVIARPGAGGYSLRATTDSSGAVATINSSHSNWAGTIATGTNASIADDGSKQTAPPVFANPNGGEYRQAPGSPTIGAGLDDAANGGSDVDGDPRTIGTTDIGADEFVDAPGAVTGAATGLSARAATLSGDVDPKGAPTSYRFEYGPTTAYGTSTAATDAGSGANTVPAAAALNDLRAATTYHYHLVATNAGGVTQGADQTFTTAAAPAPPFAGVKLVSSRLILVRRSIALTLRCPAATVGRCSGRTTLRARRVSLGRTRFSIAPGHKAKIRVRVSPAGRRLMRHAQRLRGMATSTGRDTAGHSKTTRARVTIRPGKRGTKLTR